MSSKIIYLARHAKSSWSSGASSDFERPLSNRGQSDAARIAEELLKLDWKPEVIISSPALRTKQTCKTYCEGLGFSSHDIQWENNFYAAYMVTLLHSLYALSEDTKSVMLVEHNPSMEDLLIHLCNDAPRQENGKIFTTANVIKINAQQSWKSLAMSDAKIEKILRPKALLQSP